MARSYLNVSKFDNPEFRRYVKEHTISDTVKKFHISYQTYYRLLDEFKIDRVHKYHWINKEKKSDRNYEVLDFTIMMKQEQF
jgi:DNA invertase Pin-like site-specific DNA recombinase